MERRWRQRIVPTWAAVGAAAMVALPLPWAAAAMASPPPIAHAASRCNLAGKWRTLGPTYVESLSVSHTNCSTGVSVIKAYNHCRLNAGGVKGRCASKVLGFGCKESRSANPIQFVALVRCTRAGAVVKFSYTQNTA